MRSIRTEVAIVGAGIAGLMAAIKLAPLPVAIICKNRLGTGAATDWAQGGIAAAIGPDDSPILHSLDTLRAGAGISDRAIIDILTRDAPARIEELLALGAQFDRTTHGELALGREAAHNRRRIVRAGGDATGHEILKTLIATVLALPSVTILENCVAADLATRDGNVVGVIARTVSTGEIFAVSARATVLATGGIGHLYARTTNPPGANGDGIALAARAGAVLSDMEFVQFHPTALDVGADPMPLATEAIRGEGATLVDEDGIRFLRDLHPDAELAPRDVVARAIFAQYARGHRIFIDTRAALGDSIVARFPTVAAACKAAGIDPRTQRIPVAPAAHYHMGGVSVNGWGRTSRPGLWACGEVSATGMHGANRLASNSLLEALGFATRVAIDICDSLGARRQLKSGALPAFGSGDAGEVVALARLRATMYEHVGLVRDAAGLQKTLAELHELEHTFAEPSLTLRNMSAVAKLIATAALQREESRGSHFRRDFPAPLEKFAQRSFTTLEGVA